MAASKKDPKRIEPVVRRMPGTDVAFAIAQNSDCLDTLMVGAAKDYRELIFEKFFDGGEADSDRIWVWDSAEEAFAVIDKYHQSQVW